MLFRPCQGGLGCPHSRPAVQHLSLSPAWAATVHRTAGAGMEVSRSRLCPSLAAHRCWAQHPSLAHWAVSASVQGCGFHPQLGFPPEVRTLAAIGLPALLLFRLKWGQPLQRPPPPRGVTLCLFSQVSRQAQGREASSVSRNTRTVGLNSLGAGDGALCARWDSRGPGNTSGWGCLLGRPASVGRHLGAPLAEKAEAWSPPMVWSMSSPGPLLLQGWGPSPVVAAGSRSPRLSATEQ